MSDFNNKKVSVIGAGFVGLAHSVFLTDEYPSVILFDRDKKLIQDLKHGKIKILTEDRTLLDKALSSIVRGALRPSADLNELNNSDIIFIAIGLDFNDADNGYENLNNLFIKIAPYILSNTLIVMESTLPPGTISKFVIPCLFKHNTSLNEDNLNFVYSYERVMPGPEYMSSLKTLPKVYGAYNDKSKALYQDHLKRSLPNLEHKCLPNLVSAELSKVLENSYRMVNIALVAEFAEFASKIGADLISVLEAIRERPTHSNIRFAGQAPGGYCLTKDPEFLFESSRMNSFKIELDILSASIKTALSMNVRIQEFVCSNINKSRPCTFLGISYRSGVGDLRESSALELAKALLKMEYSLQIVDPYVDPQEVQDLFDIQKFEDVSKVQGILAVKHSKFSLDKLSQFKFLVDINSCLSVQERNYLINKGTNLIQFGDFS